MPAGFIVYNDHDTVQVDETFSALSISSQGIIASPNVGPGGPDGPGGGSLPAGAINRGTAIHSAAYSAVGGTPALGLYVSETSHPIEWYAFGPPTASGGAGIQVFNASGACVFDSSRKHARVVDVFSGVTSRTYPPGRKYAVMQLATARRKYYLTEPAGPGVVWVTEELQTVAARVDVNVITTKWLPIWLFEHFQPEDAGTVPPGWEIPHTSATFAVIDVTGY